MHIKNLTGEQLGEIYGDSCLKSGYYWQSVQLELEGAVFTLAIFGGGRKLYR